MASTSLAEFEEEVAFELEECLREHALIHEETRLGVFGAYLICLMVNKALIYLPVSTRLY